MTKPLLTVLSFSGGKQSSALAWMVLLKKRGLLKAPLSDLFSVPDNFLILNADPGMENKFTYAYVQMMQKEFEKDGLDFYTVPGPNLYDDIVNLTNTDATRLDNPPYWTKNISTGKRGRLVQKCTGKYKIAPMDRFLRKYLHKNFGISLSSQVLRPDMVEKWIGFTYTEYQRVKPSNVIYIYFSYPLIDLKWSNEDVINFYKEYDLPIPPRSVCNACFANGLSTLKDMYHNRPDDWEQAVMVDESVRDWTQIGVKDEVYVSSSTYPLKDLAEVEFDLAKLEKNNLEEDYSCDQGYCFL